MRNLQLWNSRFSMELAKLRALRAPNPIRFKDNLVALYRFDESGGSALYNTAAYKHQHDTKRIVDLTRSYIRWAYYSQLGTIDEELSRPFLFCLEPNSRRVYRHCECITFFLII